ncbi:Thioesterase/thiol ester dehydrase-isomerase [Westerdykella ornata]|uniref:Thioesterase/thiol ester dehydrase-isomerase n=1 Tax=Westerdykella ornata TaxID=318751 RepID=A0A6A6JKC7_WESOR|nr:Thioesterase/thiol ester dehydrase-isomerase [Westerdykella ornata]KAF2276685.1 Thioesterase/thiol ester dehydrase-isomerase [Westerdykella ornata]
MLAFKSLSPTTFTTIHPPRAMGNARPIAYGGFALAAAYKAAALTLLTPSETQPEYHLYSFTGNYLGPANNNHPLLTSVTTIRQTRTFATRLVQVSQQQDDGSTRNCLVALADFQVAEPASLLTYSAPPSRTYTHHSNLPDADTYNKQLVASGRVQPKHVEALNTAFAVLKRLFDTRQCPEGIFAQKLSGIAKHLPTTQDTLPLTEKSTADWLRARDPLPNQVENTALLAWMMDGALAFAPLTFSGLFLEDAGPTSSLDFALRVFTNRVDLERWHLRELRTAVGAEGRSYTESRLWDEGGRCVASMTQQSILRPKGEKKGGKL